MSERFYTRRMDDDEDIETLMPNLTNVPLAELPDLDDPQVAAVIARIVADRNPITIRQCPRE